IEVLVLIAVVYALTRRRVVPDVAARAPERATALRETLWMVGYAVAALLGGLVLGLALGWHPFSFHLVGPLYGTDEPVTRLGAPLTFAVYFVGTVLPTMVFIYCVLVPRYLRLTGSTATTVILGGVTYTLLHCFDGWLAFDTPSAVALSVIFLFLQYFGPGMI